MDKIEEISSRIGRAAGRKRQEILSNILAPSTLTYLKQSNINYRKKILDLGCGNGATTRLLSGIISLDNWIIGMDADKQNINSAKQRLRKDKATNLEFHYQNLLEWDEEEVYDLVYSRNLLSQLKDPLLVLRKIFKSLNPGGIVLIEALHYPSYQCFPNSYAFDRFVELYTELLKRQGADPLIGQQISSLMQQVGFLDTKIQLVRPQFLKNNNKHIASLTLESISMLLETENIASANEINLLLTEIKQFESQKNTLITLPGIYQAYAIKSL